MKFLVGTFLTCCSRLVDKLRIDFSPSGYPVFGGESILITVCGHDSLPDRATSLFVEFEGTEQKHVSAAYRINGSTLQASIPGRKLVVVCSI